jgi:membrane protein YdbS with pleckstrin-like domain
MTALIFLTRINRVACAETESAGPERRVYIAARPGASWFLFILRALGAYWRGNEAESMGRYIDDILQPNEQVLYSTNAHWIFYWPAIVAGVVAVAFLVLSRLFVDSTAMLLCLALAAIAAIVALYKMLTAWFHRWTTETDVTNLRVVHKTGFIKRRTFEMSLDKVESVDVNQSILGRLLNYGDVTVRGVGEGAETIRTIASPLDFRNHITAR